MSGSPTPQSSSVPLPQIGGGRRASQGGGSSVTSHTTASNNGIALAVLRTQQRHQLLDEIEHGYQTLCTENRHMEDILSEEHHMVSNADVSVALSSMFVGVHNSSILTARKSPQRLPFRKSVIAARSAAAASASSAGDPQIKGSRMGALSPSLLESHSAEVAQTLNFAVQRSRQTQERGLVLPSSNGVIPKKGPPPLNCGSVNYKVLLEQQQELNSQILRDRVAYHHMVEDVVRKQSKIGEGIAGIIAS